VRRSASYEGEPAIELEWAASRARVDCEAPPYPYELQAESPDAALVVDTRPLIRAIAIDLRRGIAVPTVARRFHATLAAAIADVCVRLRAEHELDRVVLAGGVFANALLVADTEMQLSAANFRSFRAHLYPSGDGGLCLGQLAVAAARDHGAS
jgi:hydrogenase maturation protein HypF